MAEFQEWIRKFEDEFRSFTDDKKNETLSAMLRHSGVMQLRFLAAEIEGFVKHDFIRHLPTELAFYVLKFLDYKTISRCLMVSKEWNKVISKFTKVWIDACKKLGVVCKRKEAIDANWKMQLQNAVHRLKRLNYYRSFGFAKRELEGHTERVTALYYKGGLLASGSDDRTVRLWDVASGDCKHELTCHTCSDLKFDDEQVLTASCDNTLGRWEWSTGNCLTKYQGHVGGVLCVDYSTDLDLVVSGSSDCMVKIWQMSTGSCMATKLGHKDWLISVLLTEISQECQVKLQRKHVAISMSKDCIQVWSTSASEEYCCIRSMSTSSEDSPVHTYKPKLLCNGREIICSSNAGLCIWSLETFELTRMFKQQDYHLVAFGDIFTLGWKVTKLHIVNTNKEECICEMPAPWTSGYRFTDCCGETEWLSDCSALLEKGPIFFARSKKKIVVVQWSVNPDVINGVRLSLEEMAKNSVPAGPVEI